MTRAPARSEGYRDGAFIRTEAECVDLARAAEVAAVIIRDNQIFAARRARDLAIREAEAACDKARTLALLAYEDRYAAADAECKAAFALAARVRP